MILVQTWPKNGQNNRGSTLINVSNEGKFFTIDNFFNHSDRPKFLR